MQIKVYVGSGQVNLLILFMLYVKDASSELNDMPYQLQSHATVAVCGDLKSDNIILTRD